MKFKLKLMALVDDQKIFCHFIHHWKVSEVLVDRLKAQYHLLSDVILRLSNNIIIMYFDRYLSCFGIKIQIILLNLYKLKIEY